MLRQKAVCLAWVGAGLIILLDTGVSRAGGPKGTGQDLAAIKAEMIRLTNAERAKAKLAPVVEDAPLSRAAQDLAELEAREKTSAPAAPHDSPSTLLRWPPFLALGRANKPEAANAAKVIQGWMSDPEDRKSILHPLFTHIGVGVACSARGCPYYALRFDVSR
jgi:uncharacterized protein YkwD